MTIIIDSITYDVPIIDLSDTLEFLDKYAERTEDGVLHRELIGTFPKQSLKFGTPSTSTQRAEYASLWAKLGEATEFHTVTVPNVDGADFTFSAYVSGLNRSLRKWDSVRTTWGDFSANFTAQSPKATP